MRNKRAKFSKKHYYLLFFFGGTYISETLREIKNVLVDNDYNLDREYNTQHSSVWVEKQQREEIEDIERISDISDFYFGDIFNV